MNGQPNRVAFSPDQSFGGCRCQLSVPAGNVDRRADEEQGSIDRAERLPIPLDDPISTSIAARWAVWPRGSVWDWERCQHCQEIQRQLADTVVNWRIANEGIPKQPGFTESPPALHP